MSFRDQDQISDYALTDPHEYVLRGARFQCNTEDAPLLTDFEQLQVTGSGDTLAYQFSHYGGTGPNPVPVTPPMLSQFGEQQHTPEEYERLATQGAERILRNIYAEGYTEPSIVQGLGIPALISRRDALIQSKSGTGKTNTFLCGTLIHFQQENPQLQYIYVSCTREVARQIYEVMMGYLPAGTKTALCVGRGKNPGEQVPSLAEQIAAARQAQVICCTMGKFYDLYERGIIDTRSLKAICVDEWDAIISGRAHEGELSTGEQIQTIIEELDSHVQRIFVSATISEYSQHRALALFRARALHVPLPFVMMLPEQDLTLDGIRQYYTIETSNHYLSALSDILTQVGFAQCIIFADRSEDVQTICDHLAAHGHNLCLPFHGELSSSERLAAYQAFKDSRYRIMVATDLASRGLDFQGVDLVVNMDLPFKVATYIHRVGRSGRYGRKGTAVSIVDDSQRQMVEEINAISDKSKMLNLAEHALVC